MKRALPILMLIVIFLSTLAVGCGGKAAICGKYVNEDDPREYLIIKDDGTFILKEFEFGEPMTLTGDWHLEGDTLILSWMGFGVEGEVRGNKIIDNEGKVWVKQ